MRGITSPVFEPLNEPPNEGLILYDQTLYGEFSESEDDPMSMSNVIAEAMKPSPDGKHWMAVMDETGDTKILWSKDNEDEIEVARTTFKSMKKKGYTAFRVTGKDGIAGEQMAEFDPDAERIIFTKPQAGG